MAVIENLFVYGSFFEGMVHHSLIRTYIRASTPAYMIGSVYRLEVGYPVFVAEGSDRIQGQIVCLEGPDLIVGLLDEYHGVSLAVPETSLFSKITREAFFLDNSSSQQAQVYVLPRHKLPSRARCIEGGNWLESLSETPPLPSHMTERQKNYIKRLGRSSGREIIPIDLDLYRELIKLELIIDKGRRLALTTLGRDVLRYLGS